MPDPITSLIEKLEGAEVGSRELDMAVARILGFGQGFATPHLTTSLDAALAQAERVLDEPYPWVGRNRGMLKSAEWSCELVVGTKPVIETDAATPALALCAALLRAQSEARV